MSRVRNSRIGEQMKKELSQIIQLELKDPRVGFVTVTAVDVTGDLQLAKVFISVMGADEQKKNTVEALEKAKGFIRSELGKRVQLRHIPELQFKMDESIEYGNKIENLLNDIKKESDHGV